MNLIPKILHHIWIGPKQIPLHWMKTWVDKHPDWEYHLWDNDLVNNTEFVNNELIQQFIDFGRFDGAADLIRYEVLYKYGGFMPGSDCECLLPIDDLLIYKSISVYENEKLGRNLISPILGSVPNFPFLKTIIEYFQENKDKVYIQLVSNEESYMMTGNNVMKELIQKYNPEIEILPSNSLIGQWYNSVNGNPSWGFYSSNNAHHTRYAIQHWGTGRKLYK
jgi:mannosyltransferase OCH1-like enzyme